MKQRPVLFSAAMVRAMLRAESPKTQTRRIIKGAPEGACDVERQIAAPSCIDLAPGTPFWRFGLVDGMSRGYVCPHGAPGDQLWVRETFCVGYEHEPGQFTAIPFSGCEAHRRAFYRATDDDAPDEPKRPWKPSICMPRWASRITLELSDIRVERLQSISCEDAKAEGVHFDGTWWRGGKHPETGYEQCWATPRRAYQAAWETINGKGSWDANPFIWALTFTRIDARAPDA